MEAPAKPPQKKKRTPEKLAAQKAKETAHKDFMEKLDRELKDLLNVYTTPSEELLQGREQVKTTVERALKDRFGQHVGVESIGLDRLGLPVGQAPLELAVVDGNRDPHTLPSREDTLYHPLALIDALKTCGIPARGCSRPKWISSECASRPFALPEPAIVNEAMGLVLVPPDPSHAIRFSLVDDCIRKFPSMRNVLGLLYIFAASDTDTTLPPLISRILSHLTLAYYRHKYAISAPTSSSASPPVTSFYSHPSSIISPDGSNKTSSTTAGPITVPASIPSEFPPSRKSQPTVAYELLDLLRWWDALRWDHHVIMPTSPTPLLRTFDAGPTVNRTWDWPEAPLILQDPVYSLNNLATLLTPTSYAGIRTSFRSIHRNLRAGSGLPLARMEARLLRSTSTQNSSVRTFSTAYEKDYGDYLTRDMQELYARTRPPESLDRARHQTIGRLRNILERWYGSPAQYVPVLFGSSRYGVSDKQSDLDIVILDQDRPYGFTTDIHERSLPALYKLNNLANSMKRQYGKVLVIPAKVPIIKAKDPISNLHMDINVNDRLGLFNTELLEHYCKLWPPLANLIYVIKKWAKVRGLNEPAGLKRGGPTFSSYCLTLMIVGFLQSHRVLPNLHDMPSSTSNEGQRPYFWIKVTKTARMKCWVDWHRLPVGEWKPVNNPSVGRAFYAWLHYFAYDHKYDEFAIKVAEGGIVPRCAKVKAPKANGKKSKKDKSVTGQDAALTPPDPAEQSDGDADDDIEVITDDLEPEELKAAVGQAKAAQEDDAELEETLTDDTFIRSSHLEEPPTWLLHGLIVSDPFIVTKNCAANVSRKSLVDFRDECKSSLQAIDAGISLKQLLASKNHSFLDDKPTEAEQTNIRRRTNPPNRKGKKSGGNVPQAQPNPPRELVITPKQ